MTKTIENLPDKLTHQWRVQSFSKNVAKAQCVAYIDARDVMRHLDECVGVGNWADEYYQVKNTLFCKIGINVGKEWVWKSDGGAETDIESEKGEASDAFKRAAVKWGVGRFLYDLDIKYVDANEKKTSSNYPYVVDKQGKRVYDLTKYINDLNK